MNDWRPIIHIDGTPIQQGLSINPADYRHYDMKGPMVGVILEVYAADREENRTAQQSLTRRGFFHECSVLLVNTNSSSNLIMSHVVIPPGMPSGLDDYEEKLPRGSANTITGQTLTSNMAGIDPHDLDGDWCVVDFVGGSLDQPFTSSWWPHPRNYYDAGTSGRGNADTAGNPRALDQAGRYFQRRNGVEWVITKEGDIYLATTYADSRLVFNSSQGGTRGRWKRQEQAESGGSVLVEIKPTQTFEMAWDAQLDGVGIQRGNESQLPQTNPSPASRGNASATRRERTYIKIDSGEVRFDTPDEFRINSATRIIFNSEDTIELASEGSMDLTSESNITIASEDTTTITGTNLVELDAVSIKLGAAAIAAVLKGTDYVAAVTPILSLWFTENTSALAVADALIAAHAPTGPFPDTGIAGAAALWKTTLLLLNPALQAYTSTGLPSALSTKVTTE